MMQKIRIGTRGSQLALWQANHIKKLITAKHKYLSVEVITIKTTGDKILDTPLSKIGGKGLFVKEIETALLNNDIDIAVHSMKDVPVDLPENLEIYACIKREDPHDAFVSHKYTSVSQLGKNDIVGTSSLRRIVQLKNYIKGIKIEDLRGNINTRLRKLQDGQYDAIILAKAGLIRLNLHQYISETLSEEIMLPAACQGTLGIETEKNNHKIKKLITFLNDKNTEIRTRAERAFLKAVEGGCQIPVAVYSVLNDNKIKIKAFISSLDGKQNVSGIMNGDTEDPETLGYMLAKELLEKGGKNILKELFNNR